MARNVRSFADDIRARDDAELTELVLARPDLARPVPADLAALAGRAATRASLARALEQLPADEFRALEAHVVAATVDATILDTTPAALLAVSDRTLRPYSTRLWQLGLLWREGTRLRPVRALVDVLAHPAGLGPTAAALGVQLPDDVGAALAELPPPSRTLIDRLRWRHWRAALAGAAAESAAREVVRRGLATERDGSLMLPREVSLALRGGRLHESGLQPPQPATTPVDPTAVDQAGAAQGLELLWTTKELMRLLDQDPPRVLRSGGLGVREHRLLAHRLGAPADYVAFALEVAYAAGLLASDGDAEPSWRPTSRYDDWTRASRADRWATLAQAWWTTLRAPGLAGRHDADGGMVNVLGPDAAWPLMRGRRHDVLGLLADQRVGAALQPADVDAALRWRRPVRLAGDIPTHAAQVLAESDWLGATALGAITDAGRALVGGTDPALALEPALPKPVDHVLLQADLTAVAPGPLTDELDDLMRLTADVESRGGATVFRFSGQSLRRAFDHGLDAREVQERLTAASLTPLPQPLDYLIGDVARRHGQLRIGSVSSYVRSDDPGALDLLVGDPALSSLQLRRIAPTVAVSPVPAATVLSMVRDHHQGAVAETSDGGVVLARAGSPRAPVPAASPTTVIRTLREDDARALVAAMRAHEAVAAAREQDRPRIPNTDPTLTVTLLEDAIADDRRVWLGYVDPSGALQRMLFRPTEIDGGRVLGSGAEDSGRRAIALHRITGVAQSD